jgi:glucokinase
VTSLSAIGIDIGGTRLRTAALAADGRIVHQRRRATPAADGAILLSAILEEVSEVCRAVDDADAVPVGIGIAGLVGPDGMVRYGPNIGIRDLPLAEELTRHLERPVSVINDGSAAALGEQRVGAARGRGNVVMFTIGTGVGGGIVIGDELVVGANGFAGELGHIIVERDGRRCPCGNRGCIEAYASGRSIGALATERLAADAGASRLHRAEKVDGSAVSRAAAEGDALASALLHEVGHWLGIAIASCVNALDPEVVLIGGGAAPAVAPFVIPAAAGTLEEHVIGHDFRRLPPISLALLGDDAGTVGAGFYAADRAARSSSNPEGHP